MDRLRVCPTVTSSMLEVCVSPGCTSIVFGHGTCIEHDPPPLQPPGSLLDEADGEPTSLAAAAQPRRTLEP